MRNVKTDLVLLVFVINVVILLGLFVCARKKFNPKESEIEEFKLKKLKYSKMH
jgi:hypothetical protein